MTIRYTLFISVFVAGLFFAAPAFASAQTLWVYVQVYNASDGTTYRPSDFTIDITGRYASPDSFSGSSAGTRVSLESGYYSVSVHNPRGYRVGYSPNCSGFLYPSQVVHCVVTLRHPDYPHHVYPPYYPPPVYQPPVYQPPVYTPPTVYQKGYIPSLPYTGYPPASPLALGFAALILLVSGLLLYPHVRRAVAVVLR